ncbi:MAG TPA: hypothetical protein VHC19_18035 [Pirellulales bacterium]|nr:hypothetical protein [Pirellulales bacterium]
MISKSTLARLLGGLVLLPIAMLLLEGVAAVLGAMQDASGAAMLQRTALGLGLVWAFLAICLLLALAANAAAAPDDSPHRDEPRQ